MSFQPIWEFTLKKEGGFQQLQNDSANYCNEQLIGTKYGISAIAYKQRFGFCPSVEQMQNLTVEQAKIIAYDNYFVKSGAIYFGNEGISHLVFQEFFGSGYGGMKRVREAINQAANSNLVDVNNKVLTVQEVRKAETLDQKKLFLAIWNNAVEFRKTLPYAKSYLTRWNELKTKYIYKFDLIYIFYGIIGILTAILIYLYFKK